MDPLHILGDLKQAKLEKLAPPTVMSRAAMLEKILATPSDYYSSPLGVMEECANMKVVPLVSGHMWAEAAEACCGATDVQGRTVRIERLKPTAPGGTYASF